MPMLPFGEWLPDQSPMARTGTQHIRNALPSATGYLGVPSLTDTGEGGITGTATILFNVADSARQVYVFSGDPTKLYRLTSGSGFLDISRTTPTVGYNSGTPWKVALYGDRVYMVNGIDALQEYQLGVSATFGDASGLPSALTGRYVAVVRDFLVLGYINDSSAIPTPNQVRWSALGDPGDWTPDPTTLAGFQNIPDLGEVRGVTGGDYGTVLLEHGLVRMDFIGPPAIMQFDQIDGAVGCKEPSSIIRIGATTYYYADTGWHAFNGQQSVPIGAEKLDRWFQQNAISEELPKMSALNVPQLSAAAWQFTSVDTPDGKPDKLLLYAYDVGRWGIMDTPGSDCLGSAATVGITLDELQNFYATVDSVPGTVDSAIWRGSNFSQAAAIKDGSLWLWSGPTQEGELETIEQSLNPAGKTNVQGIIPLVDGNCDITVDIGTRNASNTNVPVWAPSAPLVSETGIIPTKSIAKFHRFRVRLNGTWRHANGVDVQGRPAGRK